MESDHDEFCNFWYWAVDESRSKDSMPPRCEICLMCRNERRMNALAVADERGQEP